jgi:hypothetical protein
MSGPGIPGEITSSIKYEGKMWAKERLRLPMVLAVFREIGTKSEEGKK